jgi:hypothetical protein
MTGLEVQAAVFIDARRMMKRAEGFEVFDRTHCVVFSGYFGGDRTT